MSLRSLWTREAESSFTEIVGYLDSTWGGLVAAAFVSDVIHTIAILEVFPNGGVIEVTDHGIRSIPVARQVRLFYRIDGGRLIILEFIDARTERFQRAGLSQETLVPP
ncbi:MAG: type II toxin-antitoxin system RelE/ParE family toxin [Flavobacteriales bacterium]|nr:type II toxin-antitoxin system RelE/ParE family toxin [Flavobacteriales bacterium]